MTPTSGVLWRGLSRLAVWWIKLGIVPERIEAGHPEQNGRHERMHRTLKLELRPAEDWRAQQCELDRFRQEYNEVRPHEALGMETPASVYEPSPRAYPARVPEPESPDTMLVRTVKSTVIFAGRSMIFFSVRFCGASRWACCRLTMIASRCTLPMYPWPCSTPEAEKPALCPRAEGCKRRAPFQGQLPLKRQNKTFLRRKKCRRCARSEMSVKCPAVQFLRNHRVYQQKSRFFSFVTLAGLRGL
jgi:hypothetical protein